MKNNMMYGGDYYPEQWLENPDILEKDIEYLLKAKMNIVSIGVFAWSVLESVENEYHFDWLEDVINRLYKNGISVILATPSGARPKWIADKYPEVLRVREDRTKNLFGARHNHCYTSPKYRTKVRDINTKLAERFANNPAVILWHISNEYGGECHCELCQDAFRNWLKEKYVTIEELNKKWWSLFWSHKYDNFEQVESPSSIGEDSVHGLNLDWKRFVTYQVADFLKSEIGALREGGATQPTTTNLMYDFKDYNYNKISEIIDIISWDTYPLWYKTDNIDIAYDNGMQHDFMRSLKNKPFLLMESCPTSTNWQGVSKLKKPGLLLASSLQTIAHGSNSVQYFQIRQSRGSSEKFHGAVISHYGGTDTRVFREVAEVGESLEYLSEIYDANVNAEIAIIYDVENRWAMEDAQGPRNDGLFYHESSLKSYKALKKYGLDIDIITMDVELSKYKVVIAPMLYMYRENIQSKMREFVKNGGILITTYWSGIVDETDLCFLGGTPGELMDVLGLRSEEIDGLYDWESNSAIPEMDNILDLRDEYICKNLCELVNIDTAEVIMTYGSDFYKGKPVLTCNKYEEGLAYYIGADMEQRFYDDFYIKMLNRAGVKRIMDNVPENIILNSRETDEYKYIFAQNYGKDTINMEIPDGYEKIYGDNKINVLGTLVLKTKL